jgi:FimV-like protein
VRRILVACPLLLLAVGVLWADDTKKAAETRKALKTKVSFKWKDTPFGDVVTEIKEEVKGIRIHVDNKGGVNNNKPITYTCKDKPLEEVFADLLGKNGWGYYVNNKKDAYDGDIYIKVGEERGYPKGEEPSGDEKPKEEKPKEKSKDKPKVEEKPRGDKPKEDKPKEDDPDKAEKEAARKLKLAKQLLEDGKKDGARDYLEEIIKKYKDTKAADEAEELLKKLEDK